MLRTDFVFFMAKLLQIAFFSFGHKRVQQWQEKSFFTDLVLKKWDSTKSNIGLWKGKNPQKKMETSTYYLFKKLTKESDAILVEIGVNIVLQPKDL